MSLKPIIGGAYPPDTSRHGDPALFQAVIHENFFSEINSILTGTNFTYTVRNITKNTFLKPLADLMVTDYFAFAIPDAVQEYGSGREVDITFDMDEEGFKRGFPDSSPSYLTVDKDGNFKARSNMVVRMKV